MSQIFDKSGNPSHSRTQFVEMKAIYIGKSTQLIQEFIANTLIAIVFMGTDNGNERNR